MNKNAIHLQADDNVAVVIRDLAAGEEVAAGDAAVTAREEIPLGHKVALVQIAAGEAVRKYGETIGLAARDIAPGERVHTHNLKHAEA